MLHWQTDRSHPAKQFLSDPFRTSELFPIIKVSYPRVVGGRQTMYVAEEVETHLDPMSNPGRRMMQCSKSSFLKSSSNSPLIWGYPIIEFALAPPDETRIAYPSVSQNSESVTVEDPAFYRRGARNGGRTVFAPSALALVTKSRFKYKSISFCFSKPPAAPLVVPRQEM